MDELEQLRAERDRLAEFQQRVINLIQPHRAEDPASVLGMDVRDPRTVECVVDGLRARVRLLRGSLNSVGRNE